MLLGFLGCVQSGVAVSAQVWMLQCALAFYPTLSKLHIAAKGLDCQSCRVEGTSSSNHDQDDI